MNMIPDIYIAAMITSLFALGIIGSLLLIRAPRSDRLFLSILVACMLPMNFLAFFGVRMPLDSFLFRVLGTHSEFYSVIRLLYAPLTEESAKLWIFLIPWFYTRITPRSVPSLAIAVGLGFGVGEAWTLAILLSQSPEVLRMPWYLLGGYMTERAMVCVLHAGFTAAALYFMARRTYIAAGIFLAMLLHLGCNLPLFLAAKQVFGLDAGIWRLILPFWVIFCFLAMGGLLAAIAYGEQWLQKLFRGRIRCPECGGVYKHPLFGVNLLHKRYERCPYCRHWHLVSAFDEEDDHICG